MSELGDDFSYEEWEVRRGDRSAYAPTDPDVPERIHLPLWALQVTGFGDLASTPISNKHGTEAFGRDWLELCHDANGTLHDEHALKMVREVHKAAERNGLEHDDVAVAVDGLKKFFLRYFKDSLPNG